MLAVNVSEVHAYPARPEGFEEPLFPTAASKRAIIEHFLEAPWLVRASELKGHAGQAAHALDEPVELRNHKNRVEIVRSHGRGRCSWRKRRVAKVIDRWREVKGWWEEEDHVDRLVFRVLLSGGAVVDLARDRSGWSLVGMVD